MFDQNLIIGLVVIAVVVMAVYSYYPRIRAMLGGREGFQNGTAKKAVSGSTKSPVATNPSLGAMKASTEGATALAAGHALPTPAPASTTGPVTKETFADFASYDGGAMGPVPMAGAKKPQGCYPREQLNPHDLLPADEASTWAQMNPAGSGDLQGKNFLSAGALIGVNTVGQSMRNANLQLRAEPPNPQVGVSPWQNTTIEPDLSRRPLE
jgi:hypothetical protein